MNITIPPALSSMGPVIAEFFEGMLFKLNVNSHKDALRSDDIDGLLAKMEDEIREFRDQRIQDASDPNVLSELFDTSNFAFLLYAFLRNRGVRNAREEFIEEYFDVNTETGRIYCKKTRSGSPYKVGDEITGSGWPVRIRTQHAVSGATISLLRRDIVWWTEFGYWPVHGLKYKEDPKKLRLTYSGCQEAMRRADAIANLEPLESPEEARKFPFVSQYCPKGRETNKNWGRWVYQRRHKFQLVRVGYWATPEEAAREGIKAWKSKTGG